MLNEKVHRYKMFIEGHLVVVRLAISTETDVFSPKSCSKLNPCPIMSQLCTRRLSSVLNPLTLNFTCYLNVCVYYLNW